MLAKIFKLLTASPTPPTIVEDIEDAILAELPGAIYDKEEQQWNLFDADDKRCRDTYGSRQVLIRTALTKPLPDQYHANVIRLLMFQDHDQIIHMVKISDVTTASLTRTRHIMKLLASNWFSVNELEISTMIAIVREMKKERGELYRDIVFDLCFYDPIVNNYWPAEKCIELLHELQVFMAPATYKYVIRIIIGAFDDEPVDLKVARAVVVSWAEYAKISLRDAYCSLGEYEGVMDGRFLPQIQAIISVHNYWTRDSFGDWLDRDMLADLPNTDERLYLPSIRAAWRQERAWRVLALIAANGDLLQPRMLEIAPLDDPFPRRGLKAQRFFRIAAALTLDAQGVLAARVVGSGKWSMAGIPKHAARWALGLWAWPDAI